MRLNISALTVLCLTFSSFAQAGGVWDTLTPEQQATLNRGEQIFITEVVPGKPWPRAFAYQLVDASAEECAALFTDYDSQKTYIHDLKKSKVTRRPSPAVAEVDYTMKLPIISDEDYTTLNTVSTYDMNGPAYQVSWTLVRASSTKSSDGYAKFEAQGTGSLFFYTNFVVPGSAIADLVKERALKQVRESAKATVSQIEMIRTQHPQDMARLIEALRIALKTTPASN